MFSRTDSFKFAIRIFPHSSMNVEATKGGKVFFLESDGISVPFPIRKTFFFSLDLNHDTDWKIENVKVSLPVVKSKKSEDPCFYFRTSSPGI